jgi:hypothetical protein
VPKPVKCHYHDVTQRTFSGIHLADSSGMAVREFTDETGTRWQVWLTTPSTNAVAMPGYEKGWLTFEADDASRRLRRLTPVPRGWEEMSDVELTLLCRAASEATRRRERLRRDWPPAPQTPQAP